MSWRKAPKIKTQGERLPHHLMLFSIHSFPSDIARLSPALLLGMLSLHKIITSPFYRKNKEGLVFYISSCLSLKMRVLPSLLLLHCLPGLSLKSWMLKCVLELPMLPIYVVLPIKSHQGISPSENMHSCLWLHKQSCILKIFLSLNFVDTSFIVLLFSPVAYWL